MAEAEAFAAGRKLRVTKVPFSANPKSLINGDTRGFVKILSDPATGVVLGGAIVGRNAAELISVIAVAVTNHLKVVDIVDSLLVHPALVGVARRRGVLTSRALVTGVAGFVGSHLAEALLARGDSVFGVDCFTPYYDRADKEQNLAGARGARRASSSSRPTCDRPTIEPLLDGVDVVFHQAAQAGVRLSWSGGFADYVGHNVLATQRLLEAVVAARPGGAGRVRVVVVGVRQPAALPDARETTCPQPFSPYGVTKLAAEHLCGLYAENWGVSHRVAALLHRVRPAPAPDMSIHRLCEAAIHGTHVPALRRRHADPRVHLRRRHRARQPARRRARRRARHVLQRRGRRRDHAHRADRRWSASSRARR